MTTVVAEGRTIKRIDPHVHFRDFSQNGVFTISEGMALARSQGVVAVADMPNTNPPIITQEILDMRLKLAESQGVTSGYYVYIGATGNELQLRWAFQEATRNPKVVGIKLYAGVSTGDLAVVDLDKQELVYRVAAQEGYKGVLAVHCEEESFACAHLWNPEIPSTWNLAKPPIMETEGIKNQIRFARGSNFQGHLHIAHISTPDGVDEVSRARNYMRVSCGATPHHLTFYDALMKDIAWIELKVNPPIRSEEMRDKLLTRLKDGMIDWMETDFAPHPPKVFDPTKPKSSIPSGIRSLNSYSAFLAELERDHSFTPKELEKLTYHNIKKVFRKIVQ